MRAMGKPENKRSHSWVTRVGVPRGEESAAARGLIPAARDRPAACWPPPTKRACKALSSRGPRPALGGGLRARALLLLHPMAKAAPAGERRLCPAARGARYARGNRRSGCGGASSALC